MIEQLKIAFIALSFFFGVFVFGVLVGLELPKTEFYQHWVGIGKSHLAQARPTQVAVMRMPGSGPAADSMEVKSGDAMEVYEECPGGVCKLPTASLTVAVPDEDSPKPQDRPLDLTFYSELGDKPTESGGATLMIKKRAQVGLEKKHSPVIRESLVPPAGAAPVAAQTPAVPGELWELRICSLPLEGKARLERSKLIASHPGVEVEAVTVAGKGTWYRVKISNLSERNEAERLLREFKARNYDPMIVRQ